MAFTSSDLVRGHLDTIRLGEIPISEVPITLAGATASVLPHSGIVDATVVVKSHRSPAPVRESKTLGAGWVNLSQSRLIAESVVCAKDSSLGTIYTENIDFIVDHPGGRVRRIDTGAITNGQTIVIWYDHYYVYSSGGDYAFNAADATLARKSSGLIADGQTVLVDYTISLGAVSDEVIEQPIAESGESALTIVNPAFHDAPSAGIVIGATHLAVAAVARMQAAAAMADSSIMSFAARSAARTWLEIAARYDETARQYLSRFANPVASRNPLKRG